MKKWLLICSVMICSLTGKAQIEELIQLALNTEKLAQFRQQLEELKKTYQVLYGGFTTIRDISKGNFNLHQLFLDGLLQVSPTVRRYNKIAAIGKAQLALVKEYKVAWKRFSSSNVFTPNELDYIGKVYTKLVNGSLKQLEALANVLTAGELRMSDDERLSAIDRIAADMEGRLVFLRKFSSNNSVLAVQRLNEKRDVLSIRQLYQHEK